MEPITSSSISEYQVYDLLILCDKRGAPHFEKIMVTSTTLDKAAGVARDYAKTRGYSNVLIERDWDDVQIHD